MLPIINFLEEKIGKIDYGWRCETNDSDVKILRFKNEPKVGVVTLVSVGFSDYRFQIKGEIVCFEFLMSVFEENFDKNTLNFFLSACESAVSRVKPAFRGQILPMSEEMIRNTGFSSVYCTLPYMFGDELDEYRGNETPIIFVWLLPIFFNEERYIRRNGWSAFEGEMEKYPIDMFYLGRKSIF